MTARHLPISRGQHRGVPGSISMVKLVSRILRHNHWGWGHVVEICDPPNVCGHPLHHLAQKSPSEGSRIAGLRLPSLREFSCAALSLCRLNVENVVKGPDYLVIPSLKNFFYFGPCWATLPPPPPPDSKPFTTVYPGPSTKLWARGGAALFSSKGGRGVA